MSNFTSGMVSAQIGRYQIQEKLGSGGMARVYKALDTNLDRVVAIKILHEHLTEDPTFKERFIREAKLVASIHHPNIIQVFDFDSIEVGGQTIYYMVMPYISGMTLSHLLEEMREKKQKLTTKQVRQIMADLCSALDYAHSRGMIHRDIKPGNIMFDEHNRAILTDFGIARLAENSQLTREGITVGTPAYMSPEQATGAVIDSRSDLYALGVIFYEMLTGQRPFEDDGTLSVLLHHLNTPVPRISEFLHMEDPNLDQVVFRALAKEPNERYATAAEFSTDVEAALTGTPLPPKQHRHTPTVLFDTLGEEPVIASKPASRQIQAPVGIFAAGLGVIGLLIIFALFSRTQSTAAPAAPTENPVSEAVSDSMTGAFYFATQFSPEDEILSYWPMSDSDVMRREVVEKIGYILTNSRPRAATTTLFSQYSDYRDVTLIMDARLTEGSSPASGYGIVFRYQDNDNYNVFAVDGMGRFSIWVRQDGEWTELRETGQPWTEHEAVLPMGSVNQLAIDIRGDVLAGYINGTEVVRLEDSTFDSGSVGIYTATTSEGETTVHVQSYEAAESSSFAMTDESADSMTSEEISDSMTGEEATAEAQSDQ